MATFKKDINVGDTVYLWESGNNAELLARCTVTSRPSLRPAERRFDEYVVDPKYRDEMWRAGLAVERVLKNPLTRSELMTDDVLAALAPIGGKTQARQGTNFSVPPGPAGLLNELFDART